MRNVSSTVSNLLLTPSVPLRYFVLVSIETTTPILLSSLPHDVVYNSRTYLANNKLLTYDPMSQTSIQDRSEYSIAVSDFDKTIETTLNDSGFSADMMVEVGIYDNTTGLPLLSVEDTLTLYSGLVDTWSPVINDSKRELVIKGSNPLGALDWSNPFLASPSSVRRYRSNDTTMDFIGAISEEEVTVKWGKIK